MTDRPDPRQLDLVTDAMVGAAAKELYEQWVSSDDEARMFAPLWDSLGSRKSGWLQDARIALEAAAPAFTDSHIDACRCIWCASDPDKRRACGAPHPYGGRNGAWPGRPGRPLAEKPGNEKGVCWLLRVVRDASA